MSAKIFNGKGVAEDLLVRVRERVGKLKTAPKLVSFYKPDDPGSALYTRIKGEKARSCGIKFEDEPVYLAQEAISQIRKVSEDKTVTGILVQHPTGELAFSPEHWRALVDAIAKEKDVDGLRDDSPFLPATVRAILVALAFSKVILKGCKVAVVGASGMVGVPLVSALKSRCAKVKEIDLGTDDIWFQTKNADVVISAVGQHNLIHGDQIKEGAVVVDVGSPGGDVHFESARAVASFLTPVPGGIGPLTVACLLENVAIAAEKYSNKEKNEN